MLYFCKILLYVFYFIWKVLSGLQGLPWWVHRSLFSPPFHTLPPPSNTLQSCQTPYRSLNGLGVGVPWVFLTRLPLSEVFFFLPGPLSLSSIWWTPSCLSLFCSTATFSVKPFPTCPINWWFLQLYLCPVSTYISQSTLMTERRKGMTRKKKEEYNERGGEGRRRRDKRMHMGSLFAPLSFPPPIPSHPPWTKQWGTTLFLQGVVQNCSECWHPWTLLWKTINAYSATWEDCFTTGKWSFCRL